MVIRSGVDNILIATNGTNGQPGTPGTSSYIHIKYSNDGGITFTSNNGETIGAYIGIYRDYTEQDSSSVSAYQWKKIEGEDGEPAYTVMLSNENFSISTDTSYVPIHTQSFTCNVTVLKGGSPESFTITASTDTENDIVTTISGHAVNITVAPVEALSATQGVITLTISTTDGHSFTKDITWSVATQGRDGQSGASGVSINDVVNYYLITIDDTPVTKQDSGWSTTIQSMTEHYPYLWNYEVIIGSDGSTISSTDPMIIGRYGRDGEAAAEGRGILSIAEHYQVSSSNTTPPTTWSNTPVVTDNTNKYLWNYETITYTDNTTEDTQKRVIGTHGTPGASGTSITISSTSVKYAISASATQAPTEESEWGTTVKTTTVEKQYLWTRTIVTYSDNTSTTSYSVARQGIDGTNGSDGKPGKDGTNGTSTYVHIKYSAVANPTDSDLTENPSDYIGICHDSNISDPTTASSYTWSKWQGHDGQNGQPGAKGEDGTNSYVHFAYSTSSDGSQNFSTTSFDGAVYIGILVDDVLEDSLDYEDYEWSLIKGADGTSVEITSTSVQYAIGVDGTTVPDSSEWGNIRQATSEKQYLWTRTIVNYSDNTQTTSYSVARQGLDGTNGEDGQPGTNGRDGTSTYVHIKYSAIGNPTDADLTETPSDYIGICHDSNVNDPTTASSYAWSKWIGEDGADGKPGKDGVNGTSSYTHFAYANSADGSEDFSTSSFLNAKYIGIRVDDVQADSTNYLDYTWNLIKGADGEDGVSVTVSSTQYQSGTSNTTPPTGSWSNSPVAVSAGNYLWTKVTYSDGKTAYSVARQGVNGTSVTVSTVEYAYQLSTSGTTIPTGTWQPTPQAPTTTQYAWTRTTTTFSDGSTAVTYTVGGKVGQKGDAGTDGRGIVSITEYFLLSDKGDSSQITFPEQNDKHGWTTVGEALIWSKAKPYLWHCTEVVYENADGTRDYEYIDKYPDTGWKAADLVQANLTDFQTGVDNVIDRDNQAIRSAVWENTYTYKPKKDAQGNYMYDGNGKIIPDTDNTRTMSAYMAESIVDMEGITSRVSATEIVAGELEQKTIGHYAISETNSNTATKVTNLQPTTTDWSNWELYAGATITVKFTNANTNASPSLNVNDTGAISIKSQTGSALSESEYAWSANTILTFMYDGTNWLLQDNGSLKRLSTAESTISQHADSIESKVSKDGVISSINQSAEEITIDASRVNIAGATIFTSGRLSETSLNNAYDANGAAAAAQEAAIAEIPTDISELNNDVGYQTASDVSGAIVSTTTLYYASNSTTPPNKPTAHVTTNSTSTRGAWNIALPSYNASYPYLYICTEVKTKGDSYYWTSVEQTAYASAISSIKSTADAASPKSSAVARSQRIYYRKTTSGAPNKNTTWLATSGTGYGNWSLSVPQLTDGNGTKYLYLYTAVQTQTVAQQAAGNTCTCSDVLIDDTATIIDGGTIITGTVTAREITADNLQGDHGWINLKDGKFYYGDDSTFAASDNAISWNGSKLQIKADEFLLASGKSIFDEIEAIETWFYATAPTTSNAPASSWTTDNLKEMHLRDIYFDTNSGKSYRWAKEGSTYKWVEIEDKELSALAGRVSTAETNIQTNSDQIALRATKTEVANTYATKESVPTSVTDLDDADDYATKEYADDAADTAEANAKSDTATKLQSYYTKTETDSAISQTAEGITTRVTKLETRSAGNYATSSTATGTAAKTATIVPTITGWELYNGAVVTVKFTTSNTTTSPTLNINNTGAKPIKTYSGGALSEAEYKWDAGATMSFVYDGTNWRIQDSSELTRIKSAETSITENAEAIALRATKTEVSNAVGRFATCTTAKGTAAKVATITPAITGWALTTGAIVTVKFTNENTATTPTLNVNSTGAKTIKAYTGTAALTEAEYKWKAGTTLSFVYDGSYWRIQDSTTASRLSSAESSITANTEAIALRVTNTDLTNAIDQEVTNRNAAIVAKANEITSSVSETYATKTSVPTKTSDLTNDSDFATESYADGKASAAEAAAKEYANTQISSAESRIEQTTSSIATRVTKTEAKISGHYATCSTGAGTAAKGATITPATSDWELYTGASVTVKFSNANTTASPTLNVNSKGAKAIKSYTGANLSEAEYKWSAGATLTFVYNGSNWLMQDGGTTARISSAESSITQQAGEIAAKVSKDGVIAAINLSTETEGGSTVKISADKVNIEGATIFTSGRLSSENINSTIDGRIPDIPTSVSDLSDHGDYLKTANLENAMASVPVSALSGGGNLIGNVTTKTQYCLHTSDSTAPTTGWQDTVPTWSSSSNNKYIWTRVATTKTPVTGSAQTTYSTAVYDSALTSALIGLENKADSTDAVNEVTTTQQYYLSTSQESATGSNDGWIDTVPTWSTGKYIWTRSKIIKKTVSGGTSTSYAPTNGVYNSALTTALSTAASAQDAIDNIEIGGRNLLLKTGEAHTSAGSADQNVYITSYSQSPYLASQTLVVNETILTLSFDYEVVNNSATDAVIWPHFHGNMPTVANTIASNANRPETNKVYMYVNDNPSGHYWVTFKVSTAQLSGSANINRVRLRYATDGATLKISNMKLEFGNKATGWSPAPEDIDSAIADVKATADAAAPKSSAIAKTQRIYYRSNSSTKPTAYPTAWVTESGDKRNNNATTATGWSLKRTSISGNDGTNKYLYLWCATQRQTVDGTVIALTANDIALDDSTTVIDGGNIITGSIAANKLDVDDINANHSFTVGAFDLDTRNDILNSNIQFDGRNLLQQANITVCEESENNDLDVNSYGIDGRVIYTRKAVKNLGFYLTNNNYYEPNTDYVLHFDAAQDSASESNISIIQLNSQNPNNVSSSVLYIDGTSTNYGVNTNISCNMSDNEFHHFCLHFQTSATITTTGTNSGIICQFNKNVSTKFTVNIKNLKLEKGNRESGWSASPEDLAYRFSDVQDQITTTMGSIEDTNLAMGELQQGIDNKIAESEDSLMQTLTEYNDTQLENIEAVQNNVNNLSGTVNDALGNINVLADYQETVQGFINFDTGSGLLTIGKKDNPFTTTIDNDSIDFRQNNVPVASVSSNALVITDAEIRNNLTIGRFLFKPHDNEDGGMSLVWN